MDGVWRELKKKNFNVSLGTLQAVGFESCPFQFSSLILRRLGSMARIAGLVEYRSCSWVKIFWGVGEDRQAVVVSCSRFLLLLAVISESWEVNIIMPCLY